MAKRIAKSKTTKAMVKPLQVSVTEIQMVPLNKLTLSPKNVRKVQTSETDDAELKASIRENGVKQNLVDYRSPNRLGLNYEIKLEPADVFKAVMDQRSSLSLISGIQLRRSLVMGQPRLELIGVGASALAEFKAMGCFTEIIQWKTRLFVPTNSSDVLSAILEKYPVGAHAESAVA